MSISAKDAGEPWTWVRRAAMTYQAHTLRQVSEFDDVEGAIFVRIGLRKRLNEGTANE